jgi:hypothetical protein
MQHDESTGKNRNAGATGPARMADLQQLAEPGSQETETDDDDNVYGHVEAAATAVPLVAIGAPGDGGVSSESESAPHDSNRPFENDVDNLERTLPCLEHQGKARPVAEQADALSTWIPLPPASFYTGSGSQLSEDTIDLRKVTDEDRQARSKTTGTEGELRLGNEGDKTQELCCTSEPVGSGVRDSNVVAKTFLVRQEPILPLPGAYWATSSIHRGASAGSEASAASQLLPGAQEAAAERLPGDPSEVAAAPGQTREEYPSFDAPTPIVVEANLVGDDERGPASLLVVALPIRRRRQLAVYALIALAVIAIIVGLSAGLRAARAGIPATPAPVPAHEGGSAPHESNSTGD